MGETQLSVLDVVATTPGARRTGGRLLVLTPRWSGGAIAVPPLMGQLAASEDRPVVFVVMAETAEVEAQLRRRISEAGNGGLDHQIIAVRASDWFTAIDVVRRDGDVIVFPTSELSQPPTTSSVPATMAPSVPAPTEPKPWLARLAGTVLEWAGPLLIVAGFFFIQVQIDQAVTGPLHHALVAGSVLVEIAVLWRWEQWFSGRLRS